MAEVVAVAPDHLTQCAVWVERLDPVLVVVAGVDHTVQADRDIVELHELPDRTAGFPERADQVAVEIEYLDFSVSGVSHNHIAVGQDPDAARTHELRRFVTCRSEGCDHGSDLVVNHNAPCLPINADISPVGQIDCHVGYLSEADAEVKDRVAGAIEHTCTRSRSHQESILPVHRDRGHAGHWNAVHQVAGLEADRRDAARTSIDHKHFAHRIHIETVRRRQPGRNHPFGLDIADRQNNRSERSRAGRICCCAGDSCQAGDRRLECR